MPRKLPLTAEGIALRNRFQHQLHESKVELIKKLRNLIIPDEFCRETADVLRECYNTMIKSWPHRLHPKNQYRFRRCTSSSPRKDSRWVSADLEENEKFREERRSWISKRGEQRVLEKRRATKASEDSRKWSTQRRLDFENFGADYEPILDVHHAFGSSGAPEPSASSRTPDPHLEPPVYPSYTTSPHSPAFGALTSSQETPHENLTLWRPENDIEEQVSRYHQLYTWVPEDVERFMDL